MVINISFIKEIHVVGNDETYAFLKSYIMAYDLNNSNILSIVLLFHLSNNKNGFQGNGKSNSTFQYYFSKFITTLTW